MEFILRTKDCNNQAYRRALIQTLIKRILWSLSQCPFIGRKAKHIAIIIISRTMVIKCVKHYITMKQSPTASPFGPCRP